MHVSRPRAHIGVFMNYPHHILMRTQKPARYTGGEAGAAVKDMASVKVNFCLCFPDVYEVGMSWSGLDILYSMLNAGEDVYCQRAFAPWTDMEALLREHGLPLVTLETGTPLAEMDMIGFSLNHEMGYTNVLNMLELSGIPLLSRERGAEWPLILAGGPSVCNPEPLADFVDFFYIGEAEAGLREVLGIYAAVKGRGKEAFLEQIAAFPGIYVPAFYDVEYKDNGTVKSVTPNRPGVPQLVKKASAGDLDAAFLPESFLVPNLGSVHDRAVM